MCHSILSRILTFCFLQGFAGAAGATIISVNFTDNGTAESTMLATDTAGVSGSHVANWNNAGVNGAGTGTLSSLVDSTGSAVAGMSISYTTDLGNWRLYNIPSATGEDRMWKGYLDANDASSVTVSGLPIAGPYDVILYFDGDNGGSWRRAVFTIGGVSAGGEDSENTNWGTGHNEAKAYQFPVPDGPQNSDWPVSGPNNNEGNCIRLSGITGSAFTLSITSGASLGLTRAPLNGFQIVSVPEPAAPLSGLLAAAGLLVRRPRRPARV